MKDKTIDSSVDNFGDQNGNDFDNWMDWSLNYWLGTTLSQSPYFITLGSNIQTGPEAGTKPIASSSNVETDGTVCPCDSVATFKVKTNVNTLLQGGVVGNIIPLAGF